MIDRVKTFIWKGSKAQAQKGQNDDLVMALAIGVWLYDTTPGRNKSSVDINSAMLKAFGVNRNTAKESIVPSQGSFAHNPYKPRLLNAADRPVGDSDDPDQDLTWLLK